MYAVVRSGGKQYTVREGQKFAVERLEAEPGSQVTLDEVLLVQDDAGTRVGTPRVPGARVEAEVIEQGREAKVLIYKYKSKVRYRRRRGHRQPYTYLQVQRIVAGG